jgi:hypothetical protein
MLDSDDESLLSSLLSSVNESSVALGTHSRAHTDTRMASLTAEVAKEFAQIYVAVADLREQVRRHEKEALEANRSLAETKTKVSLVKKSFLLLKK